MTGLNFQIIQLSVALKGRFGPILSGFCVVFFSKLFTCLQYGGDSRQRGVRRGYLRYVTRCSEFPDYDETGGFLCTGAAHGLSSALACDSLAI